jgi:Arc/MetJ family transcription regulator
MARTNIDLDEEMINEVMQRFALPTKKSAVDFALKRLLDTTDQLAAIEGIWGMGWDGDLDELRTWTPGQ